MSEICCAGDVHIISILLGWITPELSSSSRLSFLKCEEGLSGDIQTPFPAIRAMSEIETVLKYINSCSICVGNDDERFKLLVLHREGKFMDSNGKAFIV